MMIFVPLNLLVGETLTTMRVWSSFDWVLFCFVQSFLWPFETHTHTRKHEYFPDRKSNENRRSQSWTWDVANENDIVAFGINDGPEWRKKVCASEMTSIESMVRRHAIHGLLHWAAQKMQKHRHTRQNSTWTWDRSKCGNLFKIYKGKKRDDSF